MLTDPSPAAAPMSARQAEAFFRYLLASERLRLDFAGHARTRLGERALSANDVRTLLGEGRVMSSPRRVDGLGRSKYTLEGGIAGLDDALPVTARIVVLAAPRQPLVRVLTAMRVADRSSR